MSVLRTRDERFAPLPFFPYEPHYADDLRGFEGPRLHYVDEGPRDAREVWRGESFMAIGLRDPVLGKDVMEELRTTIRGCPPALELPQAGHFVQEWGEEVARAALRSFGLAAGGG